MPEIKKAYLLKEDLHDEEINEQLTRFTMLRTIDNEWQDHLLAVDELREGIHLRAYAERDPLVEYKRDASMMFDEMMFNVYTQSIEHYFRAQIIREDEDHRQRDMHMVKEDFAAIAARRQMAAMQQAQQQEQGEGDGEGAPPPKRQPVRRSTPKVGRNEPCPCGSGKKYKKCCGSPSARKG
jgi:preprotein translocase subunit SecA